MIWRPADVAGPRLLQLGGAAGGGFRRSIRLVQLFGL